MQHYRLSEVAQMIGVSDDTVRRWIDSDRLPSTRDSGDRMVVTGEDLAAFLQQLAGRMRPSTAALAPIKSGSARNRFPGIVTRVLKDGVMAQVEIQSGPHRIVSLMSREAADELGLEVGVSVVAAMKATNVVMEVPVR